MSDKSKLIININNIIKIFESYKNDILGLKDKLAELNVIKTQMTEIQHYLDIGLTLSNLDFKKTILINEINHKTKTLNIFINKLYLDICYVQGIMISIEQSLLNTKIIQEKKLTNDLFKKRNIYFSEFPEILNQVIKNYELIEANTSIFEKKVEKIVKLVKNQLAVDKVTNTLVTQFKKVSLEKEKVFNLLYELTNNHVSLCEKYLTTEISMSKLDSFLETNLDNNLDSSILV